MAAFFAETDEQKRGTAGKKQLGKQHCHQIGADAELGNKRVDAENADTAAEQIEQKSSGRPAEPVQDTGQSGGQKQKRTDPAECADKSSRKRVPENILADEAAGQQKKQCTHKTKDHTGFDGLFDCLLDAEMIALCPRFGNGGQQHDGDGIGHDIGKQDHGQRHSGQNTKDA